MVVKIGTAVIMWFTLQILYLSLIPQNKIVCWIVNLCKKNVHVTAPTNRTNMKQTNKQMHQAKRNSTTSHKHIFRNIYIFLYYITTYTHTLNSYLQSNRFSSMYLHSLKFSLLDLNISTELQEHIFHNRQTVQINSCQTVQMLCHRLFVNFIPDPIEIDSFSNWFPVSEMYTVEKKKLTEIRLEMN